MFLDPGVRTFQTFYSSDGICGKISNGQLQENLQALAKKHDLLWSILNTPGKVNSKTKSRIKIKCAQIRHKMRCIIDDLHWQTCAFLCKHFQNIFLPEFKVSDMVEGSPLGSKITRKMLQLSHGKFRERLIYYAKTKHRNLYITTEEYTTKTCGACGHIQDMGGQKIYKCKNCDVEIDRDYNGARNICLKVVTKYA